MLLSALWAVRPGTSSLLTHSVPQWPCLYNGVGTLHVLHADNVRLKLVLNAQNTERHSEECAWRMDAK